MLKTVVFDLGGVLIDWDPRYLYRKLFAGDHAAMESFLANVCTPMWNAQQDAGRPFAAATRALISEYPQHADLIEAFDRRWDEMLGGPIDATVAVLADVRARSLPVYGLTNWSHEKFPVARRLYPFIGWFDGIVVSGEEGCIKPNPEIYQRLFARYGIDPGEALFIDDSVENVKTSKSLGMPALHFTTASRLRTEMAALGAL